MGNSSTRLISETRTALIYKLQTCQTEASSIAHAGAKFDAVIELRDVDLRGQSPPAIRIAVCTPTYITSLFTNQKVKDICLPVASYVFPLVHLLNDGRWRRPHAIPKNVKTIKAATVLSKIAGTWGIAFRRNQC